MPIHQRGSGHGCPRLLIHLLQCNYALNVLLVWRTVSAMRFAIERSCGIVADEDWEFTQRWQAWFSTLEKEYRWTMGQKQEYATESREVLLRNKDLKVNHVCRK